MHPLISQLVSQLGVNEKQASGGAGLILNLVREKLSPKEFEEVEQAVPEAGKLADEAPTDTGGGMLGGLGGIASALGAGNIGDLAKLAGQFDKLGLDQNMIGGFVSTITEFAKKQGGDGIGNVIQGLLGKD